MLTVHPIDFFFFLFLVCCVVFGAVSCWGANIVSEGGSICLIWHPRVPGLHMPHTDLFTGIKNRYYNKEEINYWQPSGMVKDLRARWSLSNKSASDRYKTLLLILIGKILICFIQIFFMILELWAEHTAEFDRCRILDKFRQNLTFNHVCLDSKHCFEKLTLHLTLKTSPP